MRPSLALILALGTLAAVPAAAQTGPEPLRSYLFSHDPAADDDVDNFPDDWERILDREDFLPNNFIKLRKEREAHPYPDLAPGESWPDEDGVWLYLVRGNAGIRTREAIPVHPLNRYRLTGRIRTAGLPGGFACLSLVLLDAQGRPVGRVDAEPVRGDGPWRPVEIETAAIPEGGGFVRIECQLLGAGDLGASAWFDDVALYEEPILRVEGAAGSPEVAPLVFRGPRPGLTIRADGLAAGEYRREVEFAPARGEWTRPAAAALALVRTNGRGYTEDALVETPFDAPGLYRGRYRILRGGDVLVAGEFSYAILGDLVPEGRGRIGSDLVTRPAEAARRSIAPLVELGGSWAFVHVPVGRGADLDARSFAEALAILPRAGIQPIAALGPFRRPGPPGFDGDVVSDAATWFRRGAAAWRDPLRRALLDYSQRIDEWLLAPPGDASLDDPAFRERHLPEVVKAVREIAPWVRIGLPISPDSTLAADGSLPPEVDFLHLVFDAGLDPADVLADVERFAALGKPVDATFRVRRAPGDLEAPLEDVAALWTLLVDSPVRRIHLAPVATSPDTWGFWRSRGPTRLYLAARTINRLLGPAGHAGRLPIERPLASHVFRRPDGETVLALWRPESGAPGPTSLYVGTQPFAIGLDGAPRPFPTRDNHSLVETSPEPIYVLGMHSPLVETLLTIALDDPTLVTNGRKQTRHVSLTSRFPGGRDFRLRARPDRHWESDHEIRTADLETGKGFRFPVEVGLPRDVLLGDTPFVVEGLVRGEAEELPFLATLYVTVASPIHIQPKYRSGVLVLSLVNNDPSTLSIWAYAEVPGLLSTQESSLVRLSRGREVEVRFPIPTRAGLHGRRLRIGVRHYADPSAYNQEFVFRRLDDGSWELLPAGR